ncbi:adhesion G protein-coupled receptor F5 [Epinephelus fuscoguttatus]|uniref:adhesion G protein-coupled receptor F5 n=1 Tax=Epinephelus fuscoguttatus TaxID=293821 RepID=UPI0020D12F2B|nr:adhesion G protein-coupled receptor F5 [Epinephelus fuscoguttatus]
MWAFLFLHILGLTICQATEKGNSTQIYNVKLRIENNAIKNITEILKPFVSTTSLNVDDLKMTTTCQSTPDGTTCSCESGFRWSDKVCQSSQKCCGDKQCTFTGNTASMCVSNTTVSINGSINLPGGEYRNCLTDKTSEEFKECHNELLREMKKVYSTLKGFDSLKITKFRVGSVIAEFELIIANEVSSQELSEKMKLLNETLSGFLVMETKGVVHFHPPPSPVCYNDHPKLKCTLQEDLKVKPEWKLKNEHKIVFEIFNGTESSVQIATMETSVTLNNISRRWTGEYTCTYLQESDLYNISHKASTALDISLLPDIDVTTDPPFPRCRKSSDLLNIKVKCEIESSHENYIVSWDKRHVLGEIKPASRPGKTKGPEVHAADTILRCDDSEHTPTIWCTFKNRCNESRTASTNIIIIYETDQFCEADGDWSETKAGFTAVLKCVNASGHRERKCSKGSTKGVWETEFSACVNTKVNDVLQKALTVDTGLGSLDENAADVFSHLSQVTDESETISGFANMDASVKVLSTLSQKLKGINNDSVRNNFLESSSNMLDSSLNNSWTAKTNKSNTSLAERYLSSVEHLIQITNVTNAPETPNIRIAAANCTQSSECSNKVFNASISLSPADSGFVKTAGFKELENYLPNKDQEYEPNSIVVSTTAERGQLDSVEIRIHFPLHRKRRPHTFMRCVYWNNNTGGWSDDGCEWDGSSNEELCICKHLSSFAILMSKYPVKVPWITEVTYVGLSVSVVSLIISLVVELLVWNAVVKTSTLYLRHTAHVNVSLCLLVADISFLASSKPSDISEMWCKVFVVLKHFCYLSMFFWMFCLSSMLLHQATFLFHNVSKKIYLRLSLFLGYVCPLLIVVITVLSYKGGAEGEYFSHETCWLRYTALMQGSIHTFVVPVGTIVIFNVFSMLVVIMKLLDRPTNTERSNEQERKAALTVIRSVILLTPIFGVTWIFGFAVMLLDLTSGTMVFVINYAFTLLNSFQGFFILLTTCLGDKLTREALLSHLKRKPLASTTDSTTKLDSSGKK